MFSSTYIPNMKAFPFFIPEKRHQIGFQTKISITHRFRCFTSCHPRPQLSPPPLLPRYTSMHTTTTSIKSIAICGFFGEEGAAEVEAAGVKDNQLITECPSAFSSFSHCCGLLLMSIFQDCMESFRGGALQIQIPEVFKIYAKSIHSFSLGRCQGWLSKRLDEGSCSNGLRLLHPQLSVQLQGSYGEA